MPGDAAYFGGAVSGGSEVRFLSVYGCRGCFIDRDFVTASPGVYAILCSCKERLCQESTLRGLRREVRFIMSPPGKRRHNELNAAPPPETPGERARRERQLTEMLCTAEKVSVFGAKTVRSAFPSEGKVPEGRMRCRFRLRNRLQTKMLLYAS